MTKNIIKINTFANAIPTITLNKGVHVLLCNCIYSAATLRGLWLTKTKGYVPSYVEARGGDAVLDYKDKVDVNIKRATTIFKNCVSLFREETEYYGICRKIDLFHRFDYDNQEEQVRLAIEFLALNAKYGIIDER